jgi:hypothetical protein
VTAPGAAGGANRAPDVCSRVAQGRRVKDPVNPSSMVDSHRVLAGVNNASVIPTVSVHTHVSSHVSSSGLVAYNRG